MLISRKVLFATNKNFIYSLSAYVKFVKKNTILKLRASWADNCNNNNTLIT